jgi:hypothetical protein
MSNNPAAEIAFFETSCHPQESFQMALERFVNNVNEFRRAHYSAHHAILLPIMEVASVDLRGKKYARIVLKRPGAVSGSVYCFVNLLTGDVLKAGSWKAPAKGARGSIFSSDWAGYGCTEYGAAYAR